MQKNFILSVNVNGIKCIDKKKRLYFLIKPLKKLILLELILKE